MRAKIEGAEICEAIPRQKYLSISLSLSARCKNKRDMSISHVIPLKKIPKDFYLGWNLNSWDAVGSLTRFLISDLHLKIRKSKLKSSEAGAMRRVWGSQIQTQQLN